MTDLTLSLAYLAGRASGVPNKAGTISRYLRVPQILAAHYQIMGVLRVQGRRFNTDLSHQMAFQIGSHRSSGPGWFAGGTFDHSITGYPVGESMQVKLDRSSKIYAATLLLEGRKIASVSHDGKKFISWIDPAIPQDLHLDINHIFLRFVNPWLFTTPEEYATFDERCQQVEADIAPAIT